MANKSSSSAKGVTRKKGSKNNHSLEAAETTKAKRSRVDASGGSLIIWRISRDAEINANWRFAFHRSSMAPCPRAPTPRNPTVITEDGKEEYDISNKDKKKQQEERRLPLAKLREMGVDCNGGGLVRPLRKRITCSDIKRSQNRLLLPKDSLDRPLFERMLTPAERAQATGTSGLAVKIMNRALVREYDLILKFVGSIQTYRIMGRNYSKLVDESRFRVGRFLDLWLFRVPTTSYVAGHGGELKMAVVVEDDGDDEAEAAGSQALQLESGHRCSNAEEEAALGLLRLHYAPPLIDQMN